jgi:hypothetical protein
MSVWFTSDLHLGHDFVARHRGYPTSYIPEHDDMILTNMEETLPRRCKLFVLGDVGWNGDTIKRLTSIGGKRIYKVLLLGNHDNNQASGTWKGVSMTLSDSESTRNFGFRMHPYDPRMYIDMSETSMGIYTREGILAIPIFPITMSTLNTTITGQYLTTVLEESLKERDCYDYSR